MRIHLITAPTEASWILGKFGRKLESELRAIQADLEITAGPSFNPAADINHWIYYHYAWRELQPFTGKGAGLHTWLVTHIDDPVKAKMCRELGDSREGVFVCLSSMTARFLGSVGVPAERLCFIVPGHDQRAIQRRARIIITSRTYPDSRKRGGLLSQLAERMRLDQFTFAIFGSGWEREVDDLRKAGASVSYDPGSGDFESDYGKILKGLADSEYYLYLGMDEGSMGYLDAVAAGLKTIATPQGFHLDLPGSLTYPVTTLNELEDAFTQIRDEISRQSDRSGHLTWRTYAAEHVKLWRAMLDGRNDLQSLLGSPPDDAGPAYSYVDYLTGLFKTDSLRLYVWSRLRRTPFRILLPRRGRP